MNHPNAEDLDNLWKAVGMLALLAPVAGTWATLKVKQLRKLIQDLGTIAEHNHKRLNSLENGELTNRIKQVLAERRAEMRKEDAGLPIDTRLHILERRQLGEGKK